MRRRAMSRRCEQLLEVAERLFIERGYAAVSMEDIARAAGVTRPVVYDHFTTREGAYVACATRARESYEARLVERIDPTLSPREQLRAGADAYFSMVEDANKPAVTSARKPSRLQQLQEMARAGIEPATPRFSGRRRSSVCAWEIPAKVDERRLRHRCLIPADPRGYRWVWDLNGRASPKRRLGNQLRE